MQFPFSRRLFLLLALLVAAAAPAHAQTGIVSGSIRAVDGSPVAGARIEAATGGRVAGTATSDAAGNYRISGLAAGQYVLTITGTGFEPRQVDVALAAGQTATVNTTIATAAFQLDALVVSASKRLEKALEAPARVEVVTAREIEARPVTTPVDHLRTVPGVDIASTGVQSANVVARGFNNIFSGALHALSDYRVAGVPSLRVNFLQLIPSTNEDIERVEVVLGPGAALYGPNTANGILHMISKSPLEHTGTVVTVGGGERETFTGSLRTSQRLSDNFGVRLSGQYLRSNEWRYVDPAEVAERQKFETDQTGFFRAELMRSAGISAAEADARIARIGARDYDVQRWSGEGRADWRVADNATLVLSGGRSTAVNGIELTGLGASQTRDWAYSYGQARFNWDRLFVQGYVNTSNAGETFLLRNGAPIVDRSFVVTGQIQHGVEFGQQRFTYGADYTTTTPRTEGTINGWYEDDDGTREFGAYLQSETAITPQLDLVLAGRVDTHSALPEAVFSPRAAVVFKPAEGHALRASFNRAFSTPSSLNQFLDLGSAIPGTDQASFQLRQLGYSLRIQGTGANGFRFGGPGNYLVRSPFTPAGMGGPGQLIPASTSNLYPLAVGAAAAVAAQRGQPMPAALVQYLMSLNPTASLNYLNLANTADTGPLSSLVLPDIDPIRESTSNTFEVGYKGIIGGRLLLAADVWHSRRNNLVTPLTLQTPLVLINGQELVPFLVQRMMQDLGMTQADATTVAVGIASIPVGVISSADVNANGGQVLVTYVNVDEQISLYGSDISARLMVTDDWALGGSVSFVNEDVFETESAGLVTLNAPKRKGTVHVDYASERTGLNGQVRMRYTDGYPVNSGVYIGTKCLGVVAALAEECVSSFTLVDLNVGYRLPFSRQTSLQLAVTNLLDEAYRPFPGVPDIGRMVLARVKYEF
jgi:outer membrane receptor for ferrienterochelin and colicins